MSPSLYNHLLELGAACGSILAAAGSRILFNEVAASIRDAIEHHRAIRARLDVMIFQSRIGER